MKIEQILNEVVNSTNLNELIGVWNKMAKNKRTYTINELLNAAKVIREKSLTTNGASEEKYSFYRELSRQYNLLLEV